MGSPRSPRLEEHRGGTPDSLERVGTPERRTLNTHRTPRRPKWRDQRGGSPGEVILG